MKNIDRVICMVGCAAVAALGFLGLTPGALAHDPNHTHTEAVAQAKNKLGGSCCDGMNFEFADAWERTPRGSSASRSGDGTTGSTCRITRTVLEHAIELLMVAAKTGKQKDRKAATEQVMRLFGVSRTSKNVAQ